MIKKRFIVIDDGLDLMVRDINTGDTFSDAESIVDVLNDYEKENEKLKRVIEEEDKVLQSVNNELIQLRVIADSLRVIDTRWEYIKKAIQYV